MGIKKAVFHPDHTADRAIREKLCLHGNDPCEILELRAQAAIKHEVNVDGRVASYDYMGVKRWYDANGLDEDGFYPDGEPAKRGDLNRDGYRVGQKWHGALAILDKDGYDQDGRDINDVYWNGRCCRIFNDDGFDSYGYDREGYNHAGYNCRGFNRQNRDIKGYDPEGYDERGFNRDKIHKITGTERDECGYDFYGYDREGYNQAGELHQGIAIAQAYLADQVKSFSQFARERDLDVGQAKRLIRNGAKIMPEIGKMVTERIQEAKVKRIATLRSDLQKVQKEQQSLEWFWSKHPMIGNADDVLGILGGDLLAAEAFNMYLQRVDLSHWESIHQIANILMSKPRAKGLTASIVAVCRAFSVLPRSHPDRDTILRRLHVIRDMANKYQDTDLAPLTKCEVSLDNGMTFIRLTPDDIQDAIQYIIKKNGIISYRSVYECIRHRNLKLT